MEIEGNDDEESQAMSTLDDDDEDYNERTSLVLERVEPGPRSTGTRTAIRTHIAATARTHTRSTTTRSSQPYTSIRSKDDTNGEDGGMLNLFLWLGVAVVAALIVYNIQHLGEMEDTAAEEIQGPLKPSSSSSSSTTTSYINTSTTSNNNNTSMALFTNDTSNSSTILHFP